MMRIYARLTIALCLILTLIPACTRNNGEMAKNNSPRSDRLKSIPPQVWKMLSERRIFFAHQSVGANIVDGIFDAMKSYPQIQLSVKQVGTYKDLDGAPAFTHALVGRNTEPESKLEDFVQYIKEAGSSKIDIAFLKFCYVDFSPETDVETLFERYKKTIINLRRAYLHIAFIHVTAPLTSRQPRIKVWLKSLIGRDKEYYEPQFKRNRFNDLMRQEYAGKEPIFDLADVESTFPDGTREFANEAGRTYYALAPQYTDDGGHLNTVGRDRAATELLLLLSNVVSGKAAQISP